MLKTLITHHAEIGLCSSCMNAHDMKDDEMIALMNQVGFSKKETYQTIFSSLEKNSAPEPIKPGYGEGGFVVIKAIAMLRGLDADLG
jgi:hypothetical protein